MWCSKEQSANHIKTPAIIHVAPEIIHLDDQDSAWLSNERPQHGFQKKCHPQTHSIQYQFYTKKQNFI